jgi:uncharacterized membrane protein YcaP (DUF421 family)
MMDRLFGNGTDLDALQMGMRALVLFFVTLVLVRAGGMRAFGARSPFDTIVVITLGAVLARAVVGASPMVPTIVAAAVIAIVHRGLALVAAHSVTIAKLLNGRPKRLYDRGAFDRRAMNLYGISDRDLDQAARREANADSLAGVDEIWLETSGDLSVVKRAT